ncbi:MAG TPA: 2Fe-2S iron-sulfur cluster-binding protein [Candidatus Polarisedimenticolaceae bacterium]|nr:2Fe-2S iron-sulfur cluster-binding protein [Candidatus Polarisedimenticolaceae bacterium]
MPKVTIDGQELEVAAGTTILNACQQRGREIPHYCYHPGLTIAGNCRMCLVEVEKAPKLVIGCYTPVAEGMVVHTASEKVVTARAAMMEFFLINHPLDCPICDQAGECRLQEYAVEYGDGESRYTEPKLALSKAVDIGPHVMLDQERCIQCSRCIRFCDEVTKTGELGFFERGERSQIGIFPGKRLDNAYSGNVVDLCPVGALTLKEFRFATRVWYLKNTPTICGGCARGCNVVVGVGQQQTMMTTTGQLDDRVKRIVPRVNEAVNGHWICDEGRLSYEREQQATRLETPQKAGTGTTYDEAVQAAAATLKAGKPAMLASARLVAEDLFAWKSLIVALGGTSTSFRRVVRGGDDAILYRADKGANSKGAEWILGSAASEAPGSGPLLVLGDTLDPQDTAPKVAGRPVVFVGPFVSGAAEGAAVAIPSASWSEADGTFVNFEGRAQRVRRCHLPLGEARPGWRIAMDIAEAAGVSLPAWGSADDVLADLAKAVREFEGVTPETLGLLGVPAAAAARA